MRTFADEANVDVTTVRTSSRSCSHLLVAACFYDDGSSLVSPGLGRVENGLTVNLGALQRQQAHLDVARAASTRAQFLRGRSRIGVEDRPDKLMLPVPQDQRLAGNGLGIYADLWKNMKHRAFSAMAVAAFAIALAAMIPTAPLVHAQTDVESACTSSGGEYSSEVVRPHWDANPTLIETCCTGGASGQCVTYHDGVQGSIYQGG